MRVLHVATQLDSKVSELSNELKAAKQEYDNQQSERTRIEYGLGEYFKHALILTLYLGLLRRRSTKS